MRFPIVVCDAFLAILPGTVVLKCIIITELELVTELVSEQNKLVQ